MSQQPSGRSSTTVGIIGYGAIGRVLADELLAGHDGLTFGGAVGRRAPDGLRCANVDELIARCDVIVEAAGQLDDVGITTTKPMVALVDTDGDDSSPEPADRQEAFTVFEGTAREVAVRFPASTNVAATVGLCTLGMDHVQVRLIADPAAEVVTHRLQASGPIGTYDFTIANHASENPRTSAVTAYAALRALLDAQARVVIA